MLVFNFKFSWITIDTKAQEGGKPEPQTLYIYNFHNRMVSLLLKKMPWDKMIAFA